MKALALFAAGVLLLSGCNAGGDQQPLLVGAAISLREPLEAASRLYNSSEEGAGVTFSFAGSGTLRHQAMFGAPLDVFLSASPEYLDSLESAGKCHPEDRVALWSNSLVLISPVRRSPLSSVDDLDLASVRRVAVGDSATVPAGTYAIQALRSAGILDNIRHKLVFAGDVRQVLTYVETGVVDAGIVYASDTRTSMRVVVVQAIPDTAHAPIRYDGTIMAESRQRAAAEAFLEFLRSDTVRAIFLTRGFQTVR